MTETNNAVEKVMIQARRFRSLAIDGAKNLKSWKYVRWNPQQTRRSPRYRERKVDKSMISVIVQRYCLEGRDAFCLSFGGVG
jgi:hypothetical protein